MTKSEIVQVRNVGSAVFLFMMAAILLCFGTLFVLLALQGADFIPRFFIREDFYYSAQKAVALLLLGQSMVGGSIFAFLLGQGDLKGE